MERQAVRAPSWMITGLCLFGCNDSTPSDVGDSSTSASDTAGDESDTGGESSGASTSSSDTPSDTSSSSSSVDESTAANSAPQAVPDEYLARLGEPLTIDAIDGVSANDVDPDGDPIGVVPEFLTTAAGADVLLNADGSFEYEPAPGWWGEDAFEYTITDDHAGEASTTVRVVVAPTTAMLGAVVGGVGGYAMEGSGGDAVNVGALVGDAGDIDGDGLADVLVGAPYDLGNGGGLQFAVFGKSDGELVDLAQVGDGDGGHAFAPEMPDSYIGFVASRAGDVDGDGTDDMLIGAPGASPNGRAQAGRAYVVFGSDSGIPNDLGEIAAGNGGFAIDGAAAGDWLGSSASDVGDLDGDGLADFVIGAQGLDSERGAAYVVFGKADGEIIDAAAIQQGIGGFGIMGLEWGDETGWNVSGPGDVDGDGIRDLLIAAPSAETGPAGDLNPDGGRVYVVFGKADTDPVSLTDVAEGIGGFVMEGTTPLSHAGDAIGGAGDVDGDGLGDLVVGLPFENMTPTGSGGITFVVFGKADTDPLSLSETELGDAGFVILGTETELAGGAVSGAGDVDGDGLDDLIVGAPQYGMIGAWTGAAYVVYGKADTEPVVLSDVAEGIGGFALVGEQGTDAAGASVSTAGDVNADGFADVMVGARYHGPDWEGRAYVVFGGDFRLLAR